MTSTAGHPTPSGRTTRPAPRGTGGGPLGALLDLFSSIPLGIVLLVLLFVYASIGSAGVPVSLRVWEPAAWRNVREVFELSEFQWFHWWPFDLLIALICTNVAIATIRRIPFGVVNLGVWAIHAGILVLCAGSIWYFGTKVEGDTPVARRAIRIALPGHESFTITATPGNLARIGDGDEAYRMRVMSITPDWELLSGEDAGRRAYKVSMLVEGPGGMFVRELLAGRPEYTEDLVRNEEGPQPWVRARKARGAALVDERLVLSLEYEPQRWFYHMEDRALFLREVVRDEDGAATPGPWIQRPIGRMPLWNDRIASASSIWAAPGAPPPPEPKPMSVHVPPSEPGDPLPDTTITLVEYVRYGELAERRVPGGTRFAPAANLLVRDAQGGEQRFLLVVDSPTERTALDGALQMHWIDDEAELAPLREVRAARLEVELPEGGATTIVPVDGRGETVRIGDGAFTVRVTQASDDLDFGDWRGSVAIVEISDGARTWSRWVFDDPALTRDLGEGEMADLAHAGGRLDPRIVTRYVPGRRLAVRLVAGPARDRLRLLVPGFGGTELDVRDVEIGAAQALAGGFELVVERYAAESRIEERPVLVPPESRRRDVGLNLSMVRANVPVGEATASPWLPFHRYPFARPEEVLRRFAYQPTTVRLADGRAVEIMYSRRRIPLPAPVALEDFEVASHIGGFTGATSSILDWRSRVRFQADGGAWTEPLQVSVNKPREHDGLWYFQAAWDPPEAPRGEMDPGSAGLNYTVLGVANRHGVGLQLLGACLSVAGMLYAFYVKPIVKRRRQAAVRATLAPAPAAPRSAPEPQEVDR